MIPFSDQQAGSALVVSGSWDSAKQAANEQPMKVIVAWEMPRKVTKYTYYTVVWQPKTTAARTTM